MRESEALLNEGKVVGVFPESRIPKPGEETPLPFKPSAAYLALLSGAPVIPVYTNGAYFCRARARVIIGKPIYARELCDAALSEKENIERVSVYLREKIISLERQLNERTAKS